MKLGLHLYSDELRFEVHLTDSALHLIHLHRQFADAQKAEACGIIIGEIRSKSLRVIDISSPADDDERTIYSFHRKSTKHQSYLNKVHEISNGILQYIGEWHTHPEPQPRPSNCDYQGWSQLISNGKFNELPKLLWIAGNKSYKEDWFSLLLNKKYYALRVYEGDTL
ncbi:TPA: peptidase [Acinetobacter nosocomialis]|uniref:Peptidase n=1 Tax=Acinetobacter wuhouensis TaxID=1879050 RepID=A0A4Q7AF88_9GAMM|nr:Mov34/MPN/PAD-1 family protein [Acinetobacter baumannii]AUT32464.1 peptidase [Acinetobacter pittii]AZC05393.1 peptidase [Acinetobacter nosocomialis]RZG43096.1 peptidase [Acinetobacter wuhouensis]AVN16655.1 peptidase [Acinetobacter pittii]AVZ03334.1 peptidase [Acinetobacter pittii]